MSFAADIGQIFEALVLLGGLIVVVVKRASIRDWFSGRVQSTPAEPGRKFARSEISRRVLVKESAVRTQVVEHFIDEVYSGGFMLEGRDYERNTSVTFDFEKFLRAGSSELCESLWL